MPGKAGILFIYCFFLIFTAGCTESGPMTGKYAGVEKNIPGVYSFIELKDNGQGTWETEIDVVRFRWELRVNEIRLYTEAGKVIHAPLTPEGFNIELTNVGTFVFTRHEP